MSKAAGKGSGVRLPLFLLLGFIVAVAGTVIWLSLTSPPEPEMTTETAPESKTGPTAQTVEPQPPASKAGEPEEKPAAETGAAPETADAPAKEKPAAEDPAPVKTDTPAETQPSAPDAATKPEAGAGPKDPAPDATEKKPAAEAGEPPSGAAAKIARPARPDRPVMPKALPRIIPDDPLPPAPDPGLIQTTTIGALPRIGDDGRRPLDAYAKPFNRADKRPRIGIVVTGLGLSDAATESAIQGLAGGVTLAFAPYSSKLNEWIRLARAGGHEVLINVPMEPVNYPAYDPGPQTLLTSLNANGNLDRLFWTLSRATGYVGVVDFLGSRFTTSQKHMKPVLDALNKRGLMYLDSGSAARSVVPTIASELGLPVAIATLTLDERAARKDIDRKFGELEQRAKREKSAIGIASPYPVSLERIATWTRQLQARGFALAPVSALVRHPQTAQKK